MSFCCQLCQVLDLKVTSDMSLPSCSLLVIRTDQAPSPSPTLPCMLCQCCERPLGGERHEIGTEPLQTSSIFPCGLQGAGSAANRGLCAASTFSVEHFLLIALKISHRDEGKGTQVVSKNMLKSTHYKIPIADRVLLLIISVGFFLLYKIPFQGEIAKAFWLF